MDGAGEGSWALSLNPWALSLESTEQQGDQTSQS